jgi:hypothetical protein
MIDDPINSLRPGCVGRCASELEVCLSKAKFVPGFQPLFTIVSMAYKLTENPSEPLAGT